MVIHQKLLPFGRKVLEPSDINVDADTGTGTLFAFDSQYIYKKVKNTVLQF